MPAKAQQHTALKNGNMPIAAMKKMAMNNLKKSAGKSTHKGNC